MVKLQHDPNNQYKITLPKSIVVAKRWKKGDELVVEFDGEGNLVLKNASEGKRKRGIRKDERER